MGGEVMYIMRCLSIFSLVGLFFLGPAGATEVLPDRIEDGGMVIAQAIGEDELQGMRGTYMGISFSVLFEGYWDNMGNSFSNTVGDQGAMPSVPEQVQIQATVGGLYGARGIFEIVQVPGSNNVVNTNMVVNISVVQIVGQSMADISSLLPW